MKLINIYVIIMFTHLIKGHEYNKTCSGPPIYALDFKVILCRKIIFILCFMLYSLVVNLSLYCVDISAAVSPWLDTCVCVWVCGCVCCMCVYACARPPGLTFSFPGLRAMYVVIASLSYAHDDLPIHDTCTPLHELTVITGC